MKHRKLCAKSLIVLTMGPENKAAIAADTSSSAAANTVVVAPATPWLAVATTEPIEATSVAAADITSGNATT